MRAQESAGPNLIGKRRDLRRFTLAGLMLGGVVALLAVAGSAAPTAKILAPLDGAMINSGTVEITVDIQNITMNGSAIGQQSVPGEGHYHIYLDDVWLRPEVNFTTFIANVGTGPHALRIEIAENNHTEIGVRDAVNITVLSGAPRLLITSPGPSPVTWGSSSAELTLAVDNFTLDAAAVGLPPVAGHGHWHLFVDGAYRGLGTTLAATATRMAPGTHTIAVELYNNDHTPLSWRAFDQITVIVSPGSPSISFVFPTPASSLPLNFTALRVAVANFSVVDKPNQAPVAGEGHWHIFVDSVFYGMAYTPGAVVEGLAPGMHTIRAVLVGNNHAFLNPSVVDDVTVTVGGLRPTIQITAPADGTFLYGDTATLSVSVVNFTLAPSKIGQPAVMGEGHYHVFIDGAYLTFVAAPTYTLRGLTLGDHTVTVQLYNNDHTPLEIQVTSTITLRVAGDPQLSIASPLNGSSSSDPTVALSISVANFTLQPVPTTVIANAPGQGHYHIEVDGVFNSMATGPDASVPDLPLGPHVIRVFLVNNDHTPVGTGNSSATVVVTVVAAPPPPAKGFLPGFDGAAVAAALAAAAVAALRISRRRN